MGSGVRISRPRGGGTHYPDPAPQGPRGHRVPGAAVLVPDPALRAGTAFPDAEPPSSAGRRMGVRPSQTSRKCR